MGIIKFLLRNTLVKKWIREDEERLRDISADPGITETIDIPYKDSGERGHLLDVYRPANSDSLLPTVISVHGGGFVYGYKERSRPFCRSLTRRGFVVFCINYRNALDETDIPGQIGDVSEAVRWVAENAKEYGADPGRLFIEGDSAGGYLAAYSVLADRSQKIRQELMLRETGADIKAVAVVGGFMHPEEKSVAYWGLRHVCLERGYRQKSYYPLLPFSASGEMREFPPVFMHSSEDDRLNFMTFKFKSILDFYGIDNSLKYYEKEEGKYYKHIFPVNYPELPESSETIDEMCGFLLSHAGQNRAVKENERSGGYGRRTEKV